MRRLWLTITGQRCPNCWFIHGEDWFGAAMSREVQCTRPRGHAGACMNSGALHFSSARDFKGADRG